MSQPPIDYQISAADAHELAGAVLLPADLRRQVLEKIAAHRDPATMLDLFAQVLGMANAVAENCRAMVELILIERDHHRERADAALARVAELEKQEPVAWVEVIDRDYGPYNFHGKRLLPKGKYQLYAAPVAPAQHGTGYAEARQCVNCRHIGINDAADYAACHDCNWTGPEPDEDKCPGCAGENCMAAACPECGGRYDLVAEANITAPAGQVPQAWLDVQAERKRQITAEGWTPEHDDEHADGQMARAAACYALAGSSAPKDGTAALLVSLAWPWDEQWWRPSTARRDMVKACALGLAEIERLDRAAATQGGPSDA